MSGSKASSEVQSSVPDEENQQSCYVCMESEGHMLINVCACRWAVIHPACLGKLLKTQGASCRVCKVQFSHTVETALEHERALLIEQQGVGTTIWSKRPREASVHLLLALLTAITGVALMAWAVAKLAVHSTAHSQPVGQQPAIEVACFFPGLFTSVFGLRWFYFLLDGGPWLRRADMLLGAMAQLHSSRVAELENASSSSAR